MSKRVRLTLAAAAVAALLVVPVSAQAATTRLNAVVGPGFTITLKKTNGQRVTRLKPGSYRIVVRDRSSIHNFRLKGPSVNKATGIGATGTVTWTVRLRVGTYTYVCDPHASVMRGSFRVRR